jgi:hypothetical protein
VQLAAVLEGEHVGAHEIAMNRMWGGVKLLGASLELVGAAALILTPEPTALTKVGGWALGVHGSDTFATGLRQVWTGHSERTLTEQAAAATARALGASETEAERVGMIVDVAVPLFAATLAAAARIASIRAGRIVLAEQEAMGGHTIAKHIAQTEQQLQARLVAEKGIPAASSFESVSTAENVLSQAVRVNGGQIRAWAATAPQGARYRFIYDAGKDIGYGVVRATGKLQQMQKIRLVLVKTNITGKIYFILTSFPIP